MSTFLTDIVAAITGSFQELGEAIINLVKNGFIWLFCTYTESDGVITDITGASPFAYFCFILMGIALVCGLTYYIVNMARRSR